MAVVLAYLLAGVTVALGSLVLLLWRQRSNLLKTERRSRLGAEHARLHLSILARAGDEMAGALESYEDALEKLVDVVVPTFADWFAVDLLDETGDVHRVTGGHRGRSFGPAPGELGALAMGYADGRDEGVVRLPRDAVHRHPQGDGLVRRVIDGGHDEVFSAMPPGATHEGTLFFPGTRADARPAPGIESMLIVPVHIRGLALGALSFVTSPGRRGYRRSDLETAHGLGNRVAIAIERVLLWRESREAEEAAIARADQLRRLMEAALAVNAPLAEPEILMVVADHARRVLAARRASVCTVPSAPKRSDVAGPGTFSGAGSGIEEAPENEMPDLEDERVMGLVSSPRVGPEELGDLVTEACQLVIEFGGPVRSTSTHVEGVPAGTELESSVEPSPKNPAFVAVPVPDPTGASHRVIVVEGSGQETFRPEDESVLVLLAQMASVALVNAHLYQEVRGNEWRLRAVVESSPLAIAELSPDGQAHWWNSASDPLFDGSADRATPRRVPVHSESRTAWEELLERSSRGVASVGTDIKVRSLAEQTVELSVSSAPLFAPGGEVSGIVVVAEDVTERRRVLEQMQRSERLAAMARLAGGLAHDFNNLLTVILGSTELLANRADQNDDWLAEVDSIQRAGQRAAALTAQLLSIGRDRAREPVVFDPDSVLSAVQPMLQRLLGEDVALELDPSPNRVLVELDQSDFERAVLNLAINARDAMPSGGSFVLRTRASAGFPQGDDGRFAHALVAISAIDTGEGMDEQTAERCFEPFFSTKSEGRGTGLGLFAVHAFVTHAGGHVTVDTAPGRGTTFTMWFPSSSRTGDSEEPPEREATHSGGTSLAG